MATYDSDADRVVQRLRALSRWENEGGAGAHGREEGLRPGDEASDLPPLTNTELVQLRVRVIALENLVIALLAASSGGQRDLAIEMAEFISPRPGFTPHPMTLQAAAQMVSLVERAGHFRF
ncbi:MAG: hypothetical protein M3Z16_04225 [Pseudomonadota bacterium]|nr:hypothetical protein [Pseudomonadota bacterium]